MTDKRTQEQADQSNMEKDPKDWVTGDEPMTGAQRSYLKTLSEEAKEPFDESLTKADASRRIDELQRVTGRGQQGGQSHRGGGHSGPDQGGGGAQADRSGGGQGRGDAAASGDDSSQGADVDARFAEGASGAPTGSNSGGGER